jgi:hypothetical protein
MSIASRITGIRSVNDGKKSDDNLFKFLERNSNLNSKVWLLRFAFPHAARDQVINQVFDLEEYDDTPNFLSFLENKYFKDFCVLTINPFSNNFLKKMDSEEADNYKITRVKRQILRFLEGMLRVRNKNKQNYTFGCYDKIPLWNLAVVEDPQKNYTLLFKSYGLQSSEIGHNTKNELELFSGSDSLLADSFVSYCFDVCTAKETLFFKDKNSINRFKRSNNWPSLFKSNAIRIDTTKQNDPFIIKHFDCKSSFDIEMKYYRITPQDKISCKSRFFNMPSLHPTVSQNNIWAHKGICFEYIPGYTWFEVIGKIDERFNEFSKKDQDKFKLLQGFLLTQSIGALYEFRRIVEHCGIDKILLVYPYREKLIEAINETESLIKNFNDIHLEELKEDITNLSSFLSKNADTVFRDAHIKNRMLRSQEENIIGTINWIVECPDENLEELISAHTLDIDFETSKYKVTKWDDICHILLFDCSGVLSMDVDTNFTDTIDERNQFTKLLNDIFHISLTTEDVNLFWQTILFRATREHLRRVWYANIMPKTYMKRYAQEESSYYLKLARYAAFQSNSYTSLQKLLDILVEEHESLFVKVIAKRTACSVTPMLIEEIRQAENSKEMIKDQKSDQFCNLILNHENNGHKPNLKEALFECIIFQPKIGGIGIDLKKLFTILNSYKRTTNGVS